MSKAFERARGGAAAPSGKKRAAALDFAAQLQCVPVRNEGARAAPAPGNPDAVIVEVRLRYPGVLDAAARLVKARRVRRYELAGISRELFEKLDGRQTLENLIDSLAAEEQLTFLEARALLVQYLRDLMQRGLVVIRSPPDDR